MNIKPRVSIIMPSYNHGKYVANTINSVLQQTHQDFEFIITDDGSSDNTVEVIRSFNDQRIKLFVFSGNKGACVAANNCITNSSGEYIALLNSDDVWDKEKIAKQVAFLDSNPEVAAVFTAVKFIGEDGSEFSDLKHGLANVFEIKNYPKEVWLNRFFNRGNCLCNPSVLIRRSVYDDIGLFDPRMASLPDFDVWVRVCLRYQIFILDEKLTIFRIRDNAANASGDRPDVHIRNRFEYKQILKHYLAIKDRDFFMKIFPDAGKYGKVQNDTIPYFLSCLAMDSNEKFMQLWGIETLFDFIGKKENAIILENEYDFKYADFIRLSGKFDVFSFIPCASALGGVESKCFMLYWKLILKMKRWVKKILSLPEQVLNTIKH